MPGTGDPTQRMLRERAAELRELDEPQPPETGGTTRRGFLGRAAAVGAGALLAGRCRVRWRRRAASVAPGLASRRAPVRVS